MKYLFSIFYVTLTLLVLAGCSSDENEAQSDPVDQTNIDSKEEEKGKETEISSEKIEKEPIDETKLIEAVETAQVYPEITFQNVNWFYGSPDRQPFGGIWVYTSETIPSGYEDTIDWEKNDLLLVQVNDPQYIDHELKIKSLQILGDDVVKIIVSIEPDKYKTDKEVARRYASVEKGQLNGKKFLAETVEGNQLDVGVKVKTSDISGA